MIIAQLLIFGNIYNAYRAFETRQYARAIAPIIMSTNMIIIGMKPCSFWIIFFILGLLFTIRPKCTTNVWQ